ncbi:hypothetical protein [Sphingomonas sp.]|uniref:hypothetical protein n=1 Tax=Sphingomonas sp. TaxID=28214 RepID=UPI002869F208|nr:hypothetical protein [Sphingomonas sp.]
MTIFKTILIGSAGLAMVAGAAAPAAAQYAPNYGYNNGGTTIGAVINSVLGGGRYGAYGQGNDRIAVDQCARAAEARVSRDYRNSGSGVYAQGNTFPGQGYPGYNPQAYAYNSGSQARVVGITAVERRSNGLKVSGVIDSGMHRGYGNQGYGYTNQGYDPRYGYQGYDPRYGNQGNTFPGYGNQAYANSAQFADLRFSCRVDYRGYVSNVDIRRNVADRRGY